MKRFLKKAVRWTAIGLVIFVIIILAFYAEEDWRGARDWAACQRDLAAKGETLDLRQLAPPGKPEDDLSKVPIFAELFQQPPIRYEGLMRLEEPKPTRLDKIDISLGEKDYKKIPKANGNLNREPIDLIAWQKFYRSLPQAHLSDDIGNPAQDVLRALDQFRPEWTEIENAFNNPSAFWSIDYDRPYDDRYEGITSAIRLAKVLPLRAAAHFANNETDLAEKDYLFSFKLTRPIERNPNILGCMIIAGVRAIDDDILWEGIHRHAWNDAQLQEMEVALASTDMLKLAPRMFRLERAHALRTMKVLHERDVDLFKNPNIAVNEGMKNYLALTSILPSGLWNQDRLHYASMMQKRIDSLNLNEGTLNPEIFKAKDYKWTAAIWAAVYTPITGIIRESTNGIGSVIARAETYRRLARLACRLEEYRIAYGQYPESLNALSDLPAHLNQEVLSEQPLQYHRKGDTYSLYSLGWDQKDDGGVMDAHGDKSKGDWPWPGP